MCDTVHAVVVSDICEDIRDKLDNKTKNNKRYIRRQLQDYDDFICGKANCTEYEAAAHMNSRRVIEQYRSQTAEDVHNKKRGKKRLFTDLYFVAEDPETAAGGARDRHLLPLMRKDSNASTSSSSSNRSSSGSSSSFDQPYAFQNDDEEEESQRCAEMEDHEE
jgi:hypothetical protein